MTEQVFLADASFDPVRGWTGIGVAFKGGRVICGDIAPAPNSAYAQALAVLRAIEIARKQPLMCTTIVTDSSDLVRALRSGAPEPVIFSGIVADIKIWLDRHGDQIRVIWKPRERVRSARILARQTYKAWIAGR